MTEAHSTRAHAKLSPSGAYRWFACPGSVRATEGMEGKSSIFADEGTAAHTLAEICLSTDADAADYLGRVVDIKTGVIYPAGVSYGKGGEFEITDEMAEAVQVQIDTCRQYMGPDWEYELEAKLDLTHIPGMEFGTGDFCAYNQKTLELVIVDYKHGKGVPVEVTDNPQLLTYALGVARRYHNRGLGTIKLVVVQPRCPHRSGPVRSQEIDALELVEFRMAITAAAKATEAPDAPLVPGGHCRFCLAAPTCTALHTHSVKTAEIEFSDTPPEVTSMTPGKIAEVLREADTIEGWIKRVKERAHEMATTGDGVPGYKLVESTSFRKFRDDVTPGVVAISLDVEVDDVMTEPKMKSPAQVEKLIGKKRAGELADFVFKPRGKIILVPESDPRPSVKSDAESEFSA